MRRDIYWMESAVEQRPIALLYFVGSDSSADVICAFVYTVLICAFVLDTFFLCIKIIYLSSALWQIFIYIAALDI